MIVFTKELSEINTLMAYNNNVIRFYSDSLLQILNCEIIIGGQTVTIYPSPDGTFYFNFLEYIKPIVNINNFVDTTNAVLNPLDYTTYTYLGNGFYKLNIQYKVYFDDTSFDLISKNYKFLAGVEQLENYKKNVTQIGNDIALLPLYPNTNNKYYAKYFEGFPFDISFLKLDFELGDTISITNNSNLLDYVFERKGLNTRLFFSDGRTDESITDLLPIALGVNELEVDGKFIYLEKEDVCSGVYLKWFNQYGGYSYWKFPNYYLRNQSQKSIGEINTDFEDLADSFGKVSQIGMDVGERLVVNSDKLRPEQFNLVRGILTSPKVYYFTGEPFSQSDSTDWIEVGVKTSTQRTRNIKGQDLDITLDIELPDLYTQTL